jgi:uracil-DNA glycosylase
MRDRPAPTPPPANVAPATPDTAAAPGDAAPGRDPSAVLAAIRACRLCAGDFAATRTAHAPRPVLQVSGAGRAPILIVGQAPGARVHASGLPFDDPSGDRLRGWLGVGRACFYDPDRFAIAPMAFCFPGYGARGADLPPPRRCAETWRGSLMAALGRVELTLLVGGHAQAWHLGRARARSVTETVRGWRAMPRGVLALPHPSWRNTSWLRRNPWFEAEVVPWLRGEVARLLAP